MVANGQCKIKKRANQIDNLHGSETTHWSFHFNSIYSLIEVFLSIYLYGSIIFVLENIAQKGFSNSISEKASYFKFTFILHLMHKIIGITDLLCWALQQKSLDILNAIVNY